MDPEGVYRGAVEYHLQGVALEIISYFDHQPIFLQVEYIFITRALHVQQIRDAKADAYLNLCGAYLIHE